MTEEKKTKKPARKKAAKKAKVEEVDKNAEAIAVKNAMRTKEPTTVEEAILQAKLQQEDLVKAAANLIEQIEPLIDKLSSASLKRLLKFMILDPFPMSREIVFDKKKNEHEIAAQLSSKNYLFADLVFTVNKIKHLENQLPKKEDDKE